VSRRDPRVTRYIESRAPFAQSILKRLRSTIRSASPDLEESIKWGMPAFLYEGKIVCGIAGFKAHCALWFWRGKAIVGKKQGEGMGSFGRITSVKGLPSGTRIRTYVKKSIGLIEQRAL